MNNLANPPTSETELGEHRQLCAFGDSRPTLAQPALTALNLQVKEDARTLHALRFPPPKLS